MEAGVQRVVGHDGVSLVVGIRLVEADAHLVASPGGVIVGEELVGGRGNTMHHPKYSKGNSLLKLCQ